jgi:hypothetical protein
LKRNILFTRARQDCGTGFLAGQNERGCRHFNLDVLFDGEIVAIDDNRSVTFNFAPELLLTGGPKS